MGHLLTPKSGVDVIQVKLAEKPMQMSAIQKKCCPCPDVLQKDLYASNLIITKCNLSKTKKIRSLLPLFIDPSVAPNRLSVAQFHEAVVRNPRPCRDRSRAIKGGTGVVLFTRLASIVWCDYTPGRSCCTVADGPSKEALFSS